VRIASSARLILGTLALTWAAHAQPSPPPLAAYLPAVGKTVTTSATALAVNPAHNFVAVWNNSVSVTLYVAFDSAVTSSTGMPIPPGQYLMFNGLGAGQLLYGISPSGSIDVRVQEGFAR
jgi:hypothetical protein